MPKMDYLTFAVTKSCNFKCPYCSSNGAGEAQFSRLAHIHPNLVKVVTHIASLSGIRRVRLSGGEPFMHKQLGEIVRNIAMHDIDEIVLDTNASAISDKGNILTDPPRQLGIVCSIDSLQEEGYDFHSGISGMREKAIANIRHVSELGLLKRINMVITSKNIGEIPAMADFCRELGVPLKLSDVGVRRNQIGKFDDIYAPLAEAKTEYSADQTDAEFDYSQNFGTPCDTFSVGGQKVKVKDSAKGARYNVAAICGSCEFYPCSEGLYMITVMPDGTFSGCQSNGYNMVLSREELNSACMAAPSQDIKEKIKTIIDTMTDTLEAAKHSETTLSKVLKLKGATNG